MGNDRNAPVAIDLFSGAGGLSEGLLAAGINVAVAVENHPHPALTHAFNHPGTTVLCGDMRKLSLDLIEDHLQRRTGASKVDLVAGGPPCQGCSSAGKQNPRDPRNRLFKEFLRVVEHFRPRMFLFENVPGFAQISDGKLLYAILDAFWELGYRMHDIDNESEYYPTHLPTLDAVHYGVPQRRRRFILVGWLEDSLSTPFSWPKGTHANRDDLNWNDNSNTPLPTVAVKDAIGDLEFLTAGLESHEHNPAMTEYQRQRRYNSSILFNHLSTRHRSETVNMFRRLKAGNTIRSIPEEYRSGKQRMRRFSEDDSAYAILALPDDYVHYRRHRIPTVREMARLQSFDDDFVFFGKRTTSDHNRRVDVPQYTQVGNAVPPLLAKALGNAVLLSLGFHSVDLRQLAARRKRHAWIRGSSGFHGYTLAPLAKDKLSLFNMQGNKLNLPISADDEPVSLQRGRIEWAYLGRKRIA